VREEGIVVESHDDRARIRVERGSACGHCSAKALCRPFGETFSQIEVANPIGAAQGQRVVVAIEPARLVRNSLFLYGMPAAALVVGAIAGSYLAGILFEKDGADVGAIIGAAVFLGLALVVTRALDRAAARKVEGLPRIVEILED
jgi:sigma-E factor negative regulatory protein RseC